MQRHAPEQTFVVVLVAASKEELIHNFSAEKMIASEILVAMYYMAVKFLFEWNLKGNEVTTKPTDISSTLSTRH